MVVAVAVLGIDGGRERDGEIVLPAPARDRLAASPDRARGSARGSATSCAWPPAARCRRGASGRRRDSASRRRPRRRPRSERRRRAARASRPGRDGRSDARRLLRTRPGSRRTRRRRAGSRWRCGRPRARAAETARMRSSPTAWPRRSFVCLSPSRSSMTRQTRPFARARARSSSNVRRLRSPVSGSVTAAFSRWASLASAPARCAALEHAQQHEQRPSSRSPSGTRRA